MNIDQIILGCKKQDAKCQTHLVKMFADRLLPICRRYAPDQNLAYDALQDTFINIFKYIGGYTGAGSFEGWVKRIAVNCSLAYHKKKIHFEEIQISEGKINQAPNVHDEFGEQQIITLINALPKGCSIVFSMYVIEGFSHKEIASCLGITESSSRSQLNRARK